MPSYCVTAETAGAVLSSLRKHLNSVPWSVVRKYLAGRLVSVNGILCVDEGRRVEAGDVLELRDQPLPPPPRDDDVRILHLDADIVVADKPSGMLSLRHPGDVNWNQARKERQPSLEESLKRLIGRRRRSAVSRADELLPVHRIDRETSGVLLFARNREAQEILIRQFAAHDTIRRYLCVIPGWMESRTIESRQIRDRGDGLRGSCPDGLRGKLMVTGIQPVRRLSTYCELECRLTTGRTNQIRIHLAESGHPICGDVKYRSAFGQPPVVDCSNAPRLALHATELGFVHPQTGRTCIFETPWPRDMLRWIDQLRIHSR